MEQAATGRERSLTSAAKRHPGARRSHDYLAHGADARRVLAMTIVGKPVVAVLLEEAIDIAAEFYLAITLERSAKRPLVIFSTQSGIDIEQVARGDPAALQRAPTDPLLGLRDFQAHRLGMRVCWSSFLDT